MLASLRDAIQSELLHGTVDKFGKSHDEEKRATLHMLNIVLAYPTSVQQDFARASAEKANREARMPNPASLYGIDQLTP